MAAHESTNWWSVLLQLNLITVPPLANIAKSAGVIVIQCEWPEVPAAS